VNHAEEAHDAELLDGHVERRQVGEPVLQFVVAPARLLGEARDRVGRQVAQVFGLREVDRGVLRPGLKADLNLIDFDRLRLRLPEMAFDLPAGARRLLQRADGYVATLVSGTVVMREGAPTGARPGRLVRGGDPRSA